MAAIRPLSFLRTQPAWWSPARQQGLDDLEAVGVAVVERDGKISVLERSDGDSDGG